MVYSDTSSVEEYEEDLNIPLDVNYSSRPAVANDDNSSVSSELSDQTMIHCGLDYDCKPDISEVANLTLDVNYGDFANMACERPMTKQPSLVLGPVHAAMEDYAQLTWSELLEDELAKTRGDMQQRDKSPIWTRGYDETPGLASASLATISRPYKVTRRPSDMSIKSVSSWTSRPRPLDSIKRFLSRRKDKYLYDKQSSSRTAETSKSSLRV